MTTRKKKTEEEVLLSEKEVFDVMQFARSYLETGNYVYTPQLLNSRLQDINMNPIGGVTEDQLAKAMANPKSSEDLLRGVAENFEIISMVYKRALLYFTSLPAFEMTYTCTNIEKESEYNSKEYKRCYNQMKDFFNRFDYKSEFQRAFKQMLRSEVFAANVRMDGEKFVLQELPQKRILITGRTDFGLAASFDFYHFLQVGVSTKFYSQWFQDKFNELFGTNSGNAMYDPTKPLSERGYTNSSNFVLWVDLPVSEVAVFKLDPSTVTRIPFMTPLFPDLNNQNLMRGLQRSKALASAAKIIFSEIPMLSKDTKGASVKDSFGVSADALGKFLQLVKSAINTEAIRVTSAPVTGTQGIEFPMGSDIDLYSNYLKTTISSTGANSSLLFTSDTKMNAVETMLSLQIDEIMTQQFVYPQFENFLNFFVNSYIKGKYKFKFKLSGGNSYLDRQRRLDRFFSMANVGVVLPQELSSALGMSPFELESQMMEAKANDFIGKLTPILSSFNTPKEQMGEKGRPQKKQDELTDSGSDTRDAGSNLEKGGEV